MNAKACNIINRILDYFGVQVGEIFSTARKSNIVHAREAIAALVRHHCPEYSWPELSREMGRRNHSTYRYASLRYWEWDEFERVALERAVFACGEPYTEFYYDGKGHITRRPIGLHGNGLALRRSA